VSRGRKENASPRRGAQAATPHPGPPPQGGREQYRLPLGYGWLKRLLPRAEWNGFIALLDNAEMRAIFERAPQVGRILRPLCHEFGLEMPAWLKLPRRTRVRKPRPLLTAEDEERLRRMTARFPDTPPAGRRNRRCGGC